MQYATILSEKIHMRFKIDLFVIDICLSCLLLYYWPIISIELIYLSDTFFCDCYLRFTSFAFKSSKNNLASFYIKGIIFRFSLAYLQLQVFRIVVYDLYFTMIL